MKSHQRGFIQIPLLIAIIAGVLVLGAAGYFGVKGYKNYRENKKTSEEREQKLQELIDAQKVELGKQKIEISETKNKPAVINDQLTSTNTSDKTPSTADVIAQWTPNVVLVRCTFSLNDQEAINILRSYGVGTYPVISVGSGFLLSIRSIDPQSRNSRSGVVTVITNRHVINAHNGFSSPSSCEAILSNGTKYSVGFADVHDINVSYNDQNEIEFINGQPYSVPKLDAGYLEINNPDTHTRNLAHKPKICDTPPRIGDNIIILGYPSIGASSGITATEGIISGVDGSYYVTSAKVERGNSGGVAILKDQNCYLGIPSYAVAGDIESLARVLSSRSIFQQ